MNTASSLTWAQKIFAIIPLTLFLPIGIVYTFVIAALLALVAEGSFRKKWNQIKDHPFTGPVLVYTAIMLAITFLSDWRQPRFLSYLGHYLTYIFLLCFLALGKGEWKRHALSIFYIGALLAATIFYGTAFGLIPSIKVFESFVVYQGGKSILIGMLLAVAIGWMLLDLIQRFSWRSAAAIVYISGALIFIAKGRIGYILFGIAFLMALAKVLNRSRRDFIGIALFVVVSSTLAWNFSAPLRQRTLETITDLRGYSEAEVKNTSTTLRMQMYVGTAVMIAEKPFLGHGIGSWKKKFNERYGHLMVGSAQVTPHNEYLVYGFETGIAGLAAIFWLWWKQWRTGRRIGGQDGDRLVMLTAMMVVAALFNAIIRDGTYAMAFMVLLAIPFAGASSANRTGNPESAHP